MTKNEFLTICLEYFIDPSIALENDSVIDAIRSGDTDTLREILESEF